MSRLFSAVVLSLSLSACAPLRAGAVSNPGARGAFDFTPPSAECLALDDRRTTWGGASAAAGIVAGACAGGGAITAALDSKDAALGLASCAVVAGAVVAFTAQKTESLTHAWTEACTVPPPASAGAR